MSPASAAKTERKAAIPSAHCAPRGGALASASSDEPQFSAAFSPGGGRMIGGIAGRVPSGWAAGARGRGGNLGSKSAASLARLYGQSDPHQTRAFPAVLGPMQALAGLSSPIQS